MNDNYSYQLIHAIDPTKIKVPIRERFAKLTLSSNKKKNVDCLSADKPQMEKRQSASRNLLESLVGSQETSKSSENDFNEIVYKNPLLKSSSSSNLVNNDTIINTESFNNIVNPGHDNDDGGDDSMEPLQVSFGLTQTQEDGKCLDTLTQKLSSLNVEYMEGALKSDEELQEKSHLVATESQRKLTSKAIEGILPKENIKIIQNISISVSSEKELNLDDISQNQKNEDNGENDDDDDDSEEEVITISDYSEENKSNNVTKISNKIEEENVDHVNVEGDDDEDEDDLSFIPPTIETIQHLLPCTLSKEKDERILAFLKDVSFERREMSRRGIIDINKSPTSIRSGGTNSSEMNFIAKEIARADTESMTVDQESFNGLFNNDTTERQKRLLALDDIDLNLRQKSNEAVIEKETQNHSLYPDLEELKRTLTNLDEKSQTIDYPEHLLSPNKSFANIVSSLTGISAPGMKTPVQKNTFTDLDRINTSSENLNTPKGTQFANLLSLDERTPVNSGISKNSNTKNGKGHFKKPENSDEDNDVLENVQDSEHNHNKSVREDYSKKSNVPISRRSTLITNESELAEKFNESFGIPISRRSTILTNDSSDNSLQNDSANFVNTSPETLNPSILPRQAIVTNVINLTTKNQHTPICQRSTILTNVTNISPQNMETSISRRSTISNITSDSPIAMDLETIGEGVANQTTILTNQSNNSKRLSESYNFEKTTIETDDSFQSLSKSSSVPDESLIIPETASEYEDSMEEKEKVSSNERENDENVNSNKISPVSSQLSNIQMSLANINISAKFNIRIQISHQGSEDDDDYEENGSSGEEYQQQPSNRPSLPASTESNDSKDLSSEENFCQQRQQRTFTDVSINNEVVRDVIPSQINEPKNHEENSVIDSYIDSEEEQKCGNNKSAGTQDSQSPRESLMDAASCNDEENKPAVCFMSHAEKLLTQLYGSAWQTPDVIRTLKRTSKSIGKNSAEKKNQSKSVGSPKTKTPNTENVSKRNLRSNTSDLTSQNFNNSPKKTPNLKQEQTPSQDLQKHKENISPELSKQTNRSHIEESILDDFSFFRSNIVKTNLDSTRLMAESKPPLKTTIHNEEYDPDCKKKISSPFKHIQPKELFKIPQTEPVRTKRSCKTPSNVAVVTKKTPMNVTTTRSGRQVTHRWRQLIENSDSDGANASDDSDIDRTHDDIPNNNPDALSDSSGSSNQSWKKDIDCKHSSDNDSDFERNSRRTKTRRRKPTKTASNIKGNSSQSNQRNLKRISHKNTSGDDIIYLDLSQEEVSIAEVNPTQSPPANHDSNFTNRLEEILKTCRPKEKNKIPATPKGEQGKTKRRLFNANFGYEEEFSQSPKNPINPTDKLNDNNELIEDIDQLVIDDKIGPTQINIFNKQLEAIKIGKPIFQITPPRNKGLIGTKTPLITPSNGKKVPSVEKDTRTPKSVTKSKVNENNKENRDVLNGFKNCKDFKYGFLKSLDVCVGKTLCHPEALIYRENYNKKKEELASRLYDLYNEKLFNNELKVPLLWNKKLSNTAGRCLNKKKMGLRTSVIELSEKVLTSADRLRCTLIHELCHAATWIFNGEGGHGPTWKEWARRANSVFPEIPKIGVCHQYDIEYKYTYKCTLCGAKSHAHSKSKKVENIRCSFCHGAIEIFLNKKDKEGNIMPTPVKEPTGFAKFVKDNYKKYKKPDLKHADVMKILSNEFAALKVVG